jgi:hypothetical protein
VLDIFKVSNEISPLAYAKMKKKERKKASKRNDTLNYQDELTW